MGIPVGRNFAFLRLARIGRDLLVETDVESLNRRPFPLLPEDSAQQLTTLISQRMLGIFDMPEGFPDIRFDWVTENDQRERILVEASATGNWPLTGNRSIGEVTLRADIHKYAPHQLSTGTLKGKLAMGYHVFPVTYHFPGPFQFQIDLSRVPMEHLINPVAADAQLFQWLPALALRDAKFLFSPHTGQFTLNAKSDDTWTVPVGRDGIALRLLKLDLSRESSLLGIKGRIEGTTLLGGTELELSAPVDKPSVLIGQARGFDLRAAIGALCDDVPDRFVYPTIKRLLEASVQVNLADQSFSAEGSPTDSGQIRVKAYRHDGRWGFVATTEMLRSWRLSDLAYFLQPLDRIDITKLSIVATSFHRVPWDVPGLAHELTSQLNSGTNLVIPTRLGGLPEFDHLARLYGGGETLVTLIGNLNQQLTLQGKLPRLEIADGVGFVEPTLHLVQAETGEPKVWVDGLIHVKVGEITLAMTGSMQLQGQRGELSATLNEPWNQPLSTKGVVVNRLNLAASLQENVPPEVQLAGRASLQGNPGSARIARVSPLESEVQLDFDRVATMELLASLLADGAGKVPGDLRAALEAGFHDVLISQRASGTRLKSGFRLLGETGQIEGAISEEGRLEAQGSIDPIRRLRIANGRHLLELTRPDDQGELEGPAVRMELGNSLLSEIELTANCTLFAEFTSPIEARIGKKGAAEFHFEFDTDHVGFDLNAIVSANDFSAAGDFGLQIQSELWLRNLKADAVLGRVKVDAPFHGKLNLKMMGEGFDAELSGHLLWQNLKLEVPKFVLRTTPVDFTEFCQLVVDELRPHAFAIFQSAFSDSEGFRAAINDGLLTTGPTLGVTPESLGRAMALVFKPDPTQMAFLLRDLGYSTHDIALALKTVAKLSPEAAAKQLHAAQCSSNQIASALRAAYVAKPEVIAQSLRAIGFSHHPVTEALRLGAGLKPEDVARALKAASFEAGDIAMGLREHFRIPAGEVALAFRSTGIKSREALAALSPAFEINREEAELLLINAGYSPREVKSASGKGGRFSGVFG